ncbi:phage head-tail connector protein [Claveliimonas bilis]|uniref:phage head-tail connector protein n=1 Tax=Claveliimonas bilis TaxID=3028070 RepID=UPI002930F2B0|nr:phage head-tail connector protein [Claveliimonas bilis]BDZ79124.1 phage head-tail connector protein [Claveliimonas bilis]
MLEDLKRMLGLPLHEDEDLDKKLDWILSTTRARLKVLLGGIDPEDDLDYIITEVSIVRYNRIGSEGAQSHTVEGESTSFLNSDFDAYMDDIQAYKEQKNIDISKGGIRWI